MKTTAFALLLSTLPAVVSAQGVLKEGDVVQTGYLASPKSPEGPSNYALNAKRSRLAGAGVLTLEHAVLPAFNGPSFDSPAHRADNAQAYNDLAQAFDDIRKYPDGVERLVSEGRAVRIPHGSKVVVLKRNKRDHEFLNLRDITTGTAEVQLLEGPDVGATVTIPVPMLKPLPKEGSGAKRRP